jgi:hypothetical protein
MTNPREQARDLIRLASRGFNPDSLVESVVGEIREGTAGPYHIGSTVKINKPWAGPTVEGSSVSLSSGDVVSVVQANLGEQGQDKMVMLDDGKTRVVVPLDILGEKVIEQDVMTGPLDAIDNDKTGTPAGVIQGQEQGNAPTPQSVEPTQPKGQSTPSSQHPAAQKPGKERMTADVKSAVEAVDAKLVYMLSEATNPSVYMRINEFMRTLDRYGDVGAYCEAYEMLFGEGTHSLTELEDMFKAVQLSEEDKLEVPDEKEISDMSPDERKKYFRKFRKQYQSKMGSTATQSGPADQSQVMKEEYSDEEEDEMVMAPSDLHKFLCRHRKYYQDKMGGVDYNGKYKDKKEEAQSKLVGYSKAIG